MATRALDDELRRCEAAAARARDDEEAAEARLEALEAAFGEREAAVGALEAKLVRRWRSTRDAEAACYALNTAEYCAETAGQLGDIVRGKVDATHGRRRRISRRRDEVRFG